MSTDKAQLLLNQAGSLVRETEAKLAASGELFNIFSITRIERAEVNTHSAMIAETNTCRDSMTVSRVSVRPL